MDLDYYKYQSPITLISLVINIGLQIYARYTVNYFNIALCYSLVDLMLFSMLNIYDYMESRYISYPYRLEIYYKFTYTRFLVVCSAFIFYVISFTSNYLDVDTSYMHTILTARIIVSNEFNAKIKHYISLLPDFPPGYPRLNLRFTPTKVA